MIGEDPPGVEEAQTSSVAREERNAEPFLKRTNTALNGRHRKFELFSRPTQVFGACELEKEFELVNRDILTVDRSLPLLRRT